MSESYIVGEVIDIADYPDGYLIGEGANTDVLGFRFYGPMPRQAGMSIWYEEDGSEKAKGMWTPEVQTGAYVDDTNWGTLFSDPDNTGHTVKMSSGVLVFSLLRKDPAILITDRIATITIEDEAIVRFDAPSPVYGIYGENIKASLHEGFEDTDQGVYDTADTGKATIAHYTQANRLYLKGTGTVTIWAGQSSLDDPFV